MVDETTAKSNTSGTSESKATISQTTNFINSTIPEFDTSTNFADWLQRLEIHFMDHGAEGDENKQKSMLLKSVGSEAYGLLRALCDPMKPVQKSYDDLVALLTSHFTPPKIIFRERLNFYTAVKDKNETVCAWFARVKKFAMNCGFEALDEVIRDKFVIGMAGEEKIFDKLCEEGVKLTSGDALKKAMIAETKIKANASVNLVRKTTYSKGKKNRNGNISQTTNKSNSNNGSGGSSTNNGKTACVHCGWKNHLSHECRYKDSSCNICGQKSHIATVCKKKSDKKSNNFYKSNNFSNSVKNIQQNVNNIDSFSYSNDDLGGSLSMYMVTGSRRSVPISLPVNINGIEFSAECDCGSPSTIMPCDTFDRYFDRELLRPHNDSYDDYGGHSIKHIGEFYAKINSLDQTVNLNVVVSNARDKPILLGRDFFDIFGIQLVHNGKPINNRNNFVNSINSSIQIVIDQIKTEFSEVFKPELGKYNGKPIHLDIVEGTRPVFFKPRPIPLAWKGKVESQIEHLTKIGMLEAVDNSDWGTPLVPVLKPSGDIRICGDYKVTLNKYLIDYKYPLPRIDEIFASLQGGQLFTKLDLANAYNQLVLDESSSDLCTWSTHKGVFRMKRLPFGIKTAGAIFQKTIETILKDIPNCINFMDDIVITGKDMQGHIKTLKLVLTRLESVELRLNLDKCKFFQEKTSYLGFNIDKNGLSKTSSHIESILDAPVPTDVSEVRAFIGMCNFHSKFIPNFANKLNPLYELLRKDTKFTWSQKCNEAYLALKKEISSDNVLVHFDPNKPIVLTTDASGTAVAGILAHDFVDGSRRPIAFVSRALNQAERNYSTIQKEALAIVFSVTKLHQYLMGIDFVIETDHKPLLTIFGHDKGLPLMAAARMQRWAIILSGFNFQMKYIKGHLNSADSLSRMPQPAPIETTISSANYVNYIRSDDYMQLNYQSIAKATRNDPCLSKVLDAVQLDNINNLTGDDFKAFRNKFHELSVESGCVLWGYRTIIPLKFRKQVLLDLHKSHLGIVKTKSLARSYIWWPGLDKDIEETIKCCTPCQLAQVNPEKANLIPWNPTTTSWSRIHVDYAGPIHGQYVLIIIDSFSKWMEVFLTKTITSSYTIKKLRETFSRFGLVDTIVTDNGTQFTSDEFRIFTEINQIKHVFTAPGHPSSNGQAENFVKTTKKSVLANLKMAKPEELEVFLHRFMLDYRCCKHCTTGETPAKVFFGRELKTRFSHLKPPCTREKIIRNQENQIQNYNGNRNIKFNEGQKILARDYSNPNKKQWQKAIIKECLGPRNYICILEKNERLVKRHLDQLRVRHDQNDLQLNVSEDTGSAESSFTHTNESIVERNNSHDTNIINSSYESDESFHDASAIDRTVGETSVHEQTFSEQNRPTRSSALQAMVRMENLRANKQI